MPKSISPDVSSADISKKSNVVRGTLTDVARPSVADTVKSVTVTEMVKGGTTDGGKTAVSPDVDMRQSNLIDTSFALPTQQHPSLSLAQTRSRKKNGARTLYVPLREHVEEDASNVARGRANGSLVTSPMEHGQLVVVESKDEMKLSSLVENVSNTISSVPMQKLTGRPQPLRPPSSCIFCSSTFSLCFTRTGTPLRCCIRR
ncbi:hypothetical protein STCU_10073 [Strigomonas culicis]|uniref:Uncharacterized protein n=1 Tax=Strigomonas culicis TaxID=28005 RepID=S9TNI6_9TRYP|nr:hypothetical protein STCU_10073 [Strigomonas culicis]|eukprot:EPY18289.1 hypothetical protein STCU_10073 [Strigomonas culicis]